MCNRAFRDRFTPVWGAVAVLALVLSLAAGPCPAQLEAGRDSAAAGAVSPDQWRAHTLLHQQFLHGHLYVPDITPYLFKPGSPLIFSTLGCDHSAAVATIRATVAAPEAPACEIAALDVVDLAGDTPGAIAKTPPIDVLHPPPQAFSH